MLRSRAVRMTVSLLLSVMRIAPLICVLLDGATGRAAVAADYRTGRKRECCWYLWCSVWIRRSCRGRTGNLGTASQEAYTAVAAYAFLVFNLLCAPCFAAMGAIKREMNNAKWFWTAIGYQTLLAYVVSLCIYQIGNLFLGGSFGIGTVVAVLLVIGFVYLLVRPYKQSTTLNVSTKKMFSK